MKGAEVQKKLKILGMNTKRTGTCQGSLPSIVR